MTQSVLKEEKGSGRDQGYVVTGISVATERLGRDKSNSSKRLVRSRHPNKDMKHLRSQPKDNLSSHNLSMSRQTIICRDMRGRFASWVDLILP